VFACLMVCRWQVRHSGQRRGCFSYDPCLLHHGVHFPCSYDFSVGWFLPPYFMSGFDDHYVSYCGTCLVSLSCLWDFLVLREMLISLSPIVLSNV
jgi:hypothetical protein